MRYKENIEEFVSELTSRKFKFYLAEGLDIVVIDRKNPKAWGRINISRDVHPKDYKRLFNRELQFLEKAIKDADEHCRKGAWIWYPIPNRLRA